jgi:membrane protease YdiL (CAAX protease family)
LASLGAVLRRHFSGRIDPFTSAVLVFPLFLTYQVGILLSGGGGRNGVDFITTTLIELSRRDRSTYLLVMVGAFLVYAAVVALLRSGGRFHLRAFLPMLLESALYACFMGSAIFFIMDRSAEWIPTLAVGGGDVLQLVVISSGAGFHEELIFRALLLGGMARVFRLPLGGTLGWITALLISSLLFAAVHHMGPYGEPFHGGAFVYRSIAGALFGVLYQLRGFAVAAWTHALYDVLVLA